MNLIVGRKIQHGAFRIAVSQDKRKVAISSERDIAVYSLPNFDKIDTIPVKNASSMVFLWDNCSMIILNTTGGLFLWQEGVLTSRGQWPAPQWVENPLVYSGNRYVFWTSQGVVWRYEIFLKEMTEIYTSTNELDICSCEDGVLKIIGYRYCPSEQHIEITKIDYDGRIIDAKQTSSSMDIFYINRSCWTPNDIIVFSSISSPCVDDLVEQSSFIYMIDATSGNILTRNKRNNFLEAGNVFCGVNMVGAIFSVFARSVEFYDTRTGECVGSVGQRELKSLGQYNWPWSVYFLSDTHVLLGSPRFLYELFINQ